MAEEPSVVRGQQPVVCVRHIKGSRLKLKLPCANNGRLTTGRGQFFMAAFILAFHRVWPIIAALRTSYFHNLEQRRLMGKRVSDES
jgi:hypothetical protein